uniref:Uncharacterized protein n=1 Tax=Panagrolaimus sp. PS1159 TaxID=55785 RepID=A0AC35EX14_9BILA
MSIFLSDKNRFVVSPFLLNYILSYIGKFGDFSTKSVIADKYFGVNDINQMYDYFVNLKDSFSKNQNSWFLLNAFIAGVINDINQMYDYFVNLKDSFSRNQNAWFLLNAFIAGVSFVF